MKNLIITFFSLVSLLVHAKSDEIEHALICLTNKSCARFAESEETIFILKRDLQTYRTSTGQTPLHFIFASIDSTTTSSDLERTFSLARKLLERKIDINAQGPKGLTVLHDAVLFDNIEVVKFLIKNGAKVSQTAGSGKFQGMNALKFANYLQQKVTKPNRTKIIEILGTNELPALKAEP